MFKYITGLLYLTFTVFLNASAFTFKPIILYNSPLTKISKYADPVITASGSLTICIGKSVLLTATDASAGSSIQWYKNNIAVNNATQATYNAASAGSYHVVVNGFAYAAVQVTVSPDPIAGFSQSSPDPCNASVVKFTNTSSGSNLSYLWDFGDVNSGTNNTSAEANPVHKFIGTSGNTTQSFTVKLTVTTDAGCSNSQTITVTNKPVNATLMGGTNPTLYDGKRYLRGCGNTPVEFTFTNQSSTSATNTFYDIIWGDGSPNYSGAAFSSLKHTYAVGTYKINFIVTKQGGCKDTADYYVFVGSNPAVGLGNPGNTVICTGSALTFPVNTTGLNPPGTIYTVTYNDGTPSRIYTTAPDTLMHYFQITSCGTQSGPYANSFSATIVASNPCNSSTATIYPIYVSQRPKAQFTIAPNDIVCTGTTVNLTNTSIGNTVSSNNCISKSSVWSVSPASGYTITSGSLGNDFGEDDASLWTNGSDNLSLRFTTPGTYTVKVRAGGAANCGTDFITKTICVTAPPTASFTLDNQQGCLPLIVNTTNTSPASTCGNNTYQWTVTPATGVAYLNGTTATSANPQFQFTSAGTYTLRLVTTGPGGTCVSAAATQIIMVNTLPAFTLNASGNICPGSSVTPSANITAGSGLTYAWTFEGGLPANSSAVNPGTVTYSTPGTYTTTLLVSNSCGQTTLTNTVTVKELPVVTVPPDLSLCSGSLTGLLAFSSSLPGTTYTWQNNTTSIGLPASGTGNINSFVTTNTGTTPVIATITVTPRSSGCAGLPVTFKITVNPGPAAPLVTSPVYYCVNDPATALTASGSSLNWYSDNTLTNKLSAAPVPSTTSAGNTTYYVTSSGFGCESPASSIVVTVSAPINNNNIAADQTICYNTAAAQLTTIGTLTGGTGVYTYQWQSSADGVTWANISNATAATYDPGTLTASVQYRRLVNSGNCSSVSNAITITVQGAFANFDISASQSICYNTAPALLVGQTPTGGSGTYTYQWESSLNNTTWFAITGATSKDYQPPTSTTTNYYRRLATGGNCAGYSSAVTITIIPTPLVNAGSDVKICDITYQLNGNMPATGTTGAWTQTAGPAAIIANASAATTGITGLQKGNRYQFTWTISYGSCAPVSATVTIDVISDIVNTVKASNTDICPGEQVNLQTDVLSGGGVPTTLNPAYTFVWESSADGLSNWQAVAGGTSESIQVIPASNTYYRRKTKSHNLCEYVSNSILIKVQPGISGNNISGISQVCTGKPVGILTGSPVTGGDGNFLSQWQMSLNGSTWTTIANATGQNLSVQPLTQTTYYRRLAGSASCSVVQSASNIWQITVNPDSKAEFTATTTTGCITFNLSTVIRPVPHDDRNSTYEWFANGISIGTGSSFPGYIITTDGTSVDIKLRTTSKFGCNTDEQQLTFSTVKAVIASFTKDQTKGCGPLSTHFVNTSAPLNGATYLWDFGNGQTSVKVQPDDVIFTPHPLNRDTTYHIKLAVTTACTTTYYTDTVKVRPKPKAIFTPDKTIGCSPFEVTLTNQSRGLPNTYTYYFGNGDKQVVTGNQAIKYTYVTNKTDTLILKLVAENECGKDSSFYKIVVFPNTVQAKLVVNGDNQFGCTSLPVTFNNNSTGANIFSWDFGDGNTTVTTQSPGVLQHTFATPGTYNVKLTASNGCATATAFQSITVYAAPDAAFSVKQYCIGVPVAFTNKTGPGSFAYLWDFGDGQTSNNNNPKHLYAEPGKYVITLTVLQPYQNGVSCTSSASYQLDIPPPPKADFTVLPGSIIKIPDYSFKFSNNSSGNPVSVKWNFGDGKTATTIDAEHTYTDTGSYKVTLTVTAANGCTDVLVKTVKVEDVPGYLFVPNAFEPSSFKSEIKTFTVRASGLSKYSLRIFNKWGEMVWESDKLDPDGSPAEGWDGMMHGQPAPQGVYVWLISAQYINKTEWKGMKYKTGSYARTGPIHLIR